MRENSPRERLLLGVMLWGTLSGTLGAGLLLLHLLILSPFEFEGARHPGFVALQIFSMSILQNLSILAMLGLLAKIASLILSHLNLSFRPLFVVRTFGIFLTAVPLGMTWIAFGSWNGRLDAKTLLTLPAALLALFLASLLAASRMAKPKEHGWGAVIVAYAAALCAGLIYVWPLFFPQSLATAQTVAVAPLPPRPATCNLGPANKPRAVIFITIDTLRADHLGCYGYPRNVSPTIDRLAQEGLLFENMISASSGTIPSMCTLFSGLNPQCHAAMDQQGTLIPEIKTLAERFQEAGFYTAGISAHPVLNEERGFAQGFNRFLALEDPPAKDLVQKARQLLDQLPDQPLFFWIHFMDPHTPYDPPPELYNDLLTDNLFNPRLLPLIKYGSYNGVKLKRTFTGKVGKAKVEEGYVVARYDGEIRSADRGVGEILEFLEARGVLQDAALFLTADHGETLYRGPRDIYFQHALDVYQSCIHVPAIVWAPGRIPGGQRISTLVRHIDIFPTLLAMAAIPGESKNPVYNGLNLLAPELTADMYPAFYISQTVWWDALSLKMLPPDKRQPAFALIQDGWKYIRYPHTDLLHIRGPRTFIHAWRSCVAGLWFPDQLYHLDADPQETTDLIASQPARAEKMRQELSRQLEAQKQLACNFQPREVISDKKVIEQLKALGYVD